MNSLEPKSSFWNQNIPCPIEVAEFLKKYWDDSSIVKGTSDWQPPIFLYHEERGEHNYVDASALYGGGSSPTIQFAIMESREILNLTRDGILIDDNTRGQVLSAFSKIDFVLDVLVCLEMGVYKGKIEVSDMEKELKNDGLFSNTFKKLKYLKLKGSISKSSYTWLDYARQIRNNLAHSYLPMGDYGVNQKVLSEMKNHTEAIDYVFNVAWFKILNDYSPRQVIIVKWLNKVSSKAILSV